MTRLLLFLACLTACWTGTTHTHRVPTMHVRATRPTPRPTAESGTACQEMLGALNRAYETPSLDYCDGELSNEDYWYCIAAVSNERASSINEAAYWTVMYCTESAE